MFDGSKTTLYFETDPRSPISVYGKSKRTVARAFETPWSRYLLIHSSWVYRAHGSDFSLSMLRLEAERPELRVIDDQFGAPTWARDIAANAAAILQRADGKGSA